MKKTLLVVLIGLVALGVGGGVYVYADDDVSFSQIVELFISLGIIPEENAEKARSAVAGLTGEEAATEEPLNKEHVEVAVSQYIEYAGLEYAVGEQIAGLLLTAKNTHSESVTLEAKRRCQVVYRILGEDDKVLYDSRTAENCQTDEEVVFLMEPGQVRVFPVSHDPSTFRLAAGEYDIEIEYPGYGGGTKRIRIYEE